MPSVKVARRHEERTSRLEIVPNTFGGVNTHLWRNETYSVGIVPAVRHTYSLLVNKKKGMGKEQEGRGLLVGFNISRSNMAGYPEQKILNHETEDGVISITEEARGDADRLGLADDR